MYEVGKQKEIKTVLSLQSALKLVSKELPSYHGYHISKDIALLPDVQRCRKRE